MDLAQKLQLRPDQLVDVVQAPASLTALLEPFRSRPLGITESALLVFTRTSADVEAHRALILSSARADRVTWVAYPKSGQLETDLNRDTLAADVSRGGVQPVRQIAIDDVWSALRFRPAK